MDDLTKLFRDQPETPRDRLVQQWLMRTDNGSDFIDTRQVMEEIVSQIPNALDAGSSEPSITMKLPAAPNVRKNLRKILAPTEPKESRGELHIDPSRYIKHTNDVYGLPFLRHDLEKRRLWLGFNDSWDQLAEAPSSLSEVSRALEHVENYMDTVDLGKSTEKLQVKMSMYESLLYILASPFFCAFMKDKRIRTGKIDRRGPRYLFIHGPSHNGKSTFLRFALKIMTGFDVTPLGRTDFTKTRIADRISLVNVFPFVFDDITVSSSGGHEDLLKSYWETWWHDEYTHFPQLIMTG